MKPGPRGLLWWIIVTLVAVQLYVVQELLAALALFTVVFLAFAALVGVVRLMQYGWERAFAWSEAEFGGSLNRRLFRRPRSATAR